MKFALLLSLLSFPAHASSVGMCSAELKYLDGREQTAVMSCEDENAGKCLNEVVLKDGTHDWQEVSCQ
jgi:hypothetical protein